MPIYEYACRGCGHQFEYLVRSNSPAASCPECQKQDLEQKVSLSAMSSEGTREVNLAGAHRKAAAGRNAKSRDEHAAHHNHFES